MTHQQLTFDSHKSPRHVPIMLPYQHHLSSTNPNLPTTRQAFANYFLSLRSNAPIVVCQSIGSEKDKSSLTSQFSKTFAQLHSSLLPRLYPSTALSNVPQQQLNFTSNGSKLVSTYDELLSTTLKIDVLFPNYIFIICCPTTTPSRLERETPCTDSIRYDSNFIWSNPSRALSSSG